MASGEPARDADALLEVLYDRARALVGTPGELFIRVPPTRAGVKASIAVGMVHARGNGATILEALEAIISQLEDAGEQQAIRDANSTTRPATRPVENVQAPERPAFQLRAPKR